MGGPVAASVRHRRAAISSDLAVVPIVRQARATAPGVGLVLAVAFALVGTPLFAQQPSLGTEAQRANGKQLYDKFCAQCHGDDGKGVGVAAPALLPRPRDLTAGKYKIRSTPSGALPTDRDLKNIIRRGMPYSSMPAWPDFSERELTDLVYYVKSFAPDFADPEAVAEGMTIPSPPKMTEETIAKGREAYEQLGCIGCHGELGRGDGMSAPTLRDDWGHFIRAADLTAKWTFRGGATREDLFRTFSTGLNGAPMPSYADALSDEDRWNLVDYVYSLSPSEEAPYATHVLVHPVDGELDLERGAELFEGAPPAMFPVVGQIMQPGRAFHPLVTHVQVQAVYGASEIAFLVRWNDLIADTSGNNDPTLEVPPFDYDAAGAAPSEAGGEESFWGEEAAEGGGAADDFWGEESGGGDDFWGEEPDAPAASASTSQFSDAIAIQLPATLPEGNRKPYFLFGDAGSPVDLWYVDLADGQARRYVARGSADITASGRSAVTSVSSYDRGQWSVIFKRPLQVAEGVAFAQDQFVPVAFSVWDGFNEERGNKHGLTQWVYAYVEPREQPSALGPMVRAGLGVLAVELLLIAWLRWRHRRQPRPSPVGREAVA